MIAFDDDSEVSGTAVAGLSVAHTCTGANRILMAGAAQSSVAVGTVTATYNAVGMTSTSSHKNTADFLRNTLFSLVAPATGANTLACTFSKTEDEAALGGTSYTDIHQSSPVGTPNTNEGASATVAVASAVGEVVVGLVYVYNTGDAALTAGAGQTQRWEVEDIAGAGTVDAGMSDEAGATSVTFSYDGLFTDSVISGVSLKPAPPTTVTKTIKSSGGDYASLALLEAANANLVVLNEIWDVRWDNLEETTGVTFTGWVTDSTRYLRVRPAAGVSHGSKGVITTSGPRLVVNGTCLTVNNIGEGGLVKFEGIQFQSTAAGGFCLKHSNNGTHVASVQYKDCVFVGANAGVDADGGATTTNDSVFTNCIFKCVQACVVRQYRDMTLAGCTCISTASGAHGVNWGANDGRAKRALNCYSRSAGGGGSAYNSVFTADQAASSDTTGDIDNVAYDTTNFTNVTGGTEDFRLVATATTLLGTGFDRAAEVDPLNYTTDIRGVTRPVTGDDIGAFQLVGPPTAEFSADPLTGDAPLTVDFTDESTGGDPDSWAWDFGDSIGTSTDQNPSYEYEDPGTYTVTLTVTNVDGSDEEEKVNYITVTGGLHGYRSFFVLGGP